MQLIDFRNFLPFNELRKEMRSAPFITELKTKDSSWISSDLKDILNRLNNEGIEIDISDIRVNKDKTFSYKGQKILIYIKSWNYNSYNDSLSEYKFHLTTCQTLRQYKKKNNLERYIASTRDTGDFYINKRDSYTGEFVEEDILYVIKVCKHCLRETNYKNYKNRDITGKDYIYNNFNLKEFFKDNITNHELLPNNKQQIQHTKATYQKNIVKKNKPTILKPSVKPEFTKGENNKIKNEKLLKTRDITLIIIELRNRINNKRKLFIPTTKGYSIEGKLPSTIVENKDSFEIWIKDIYVYFYESSGGGYAVYPIKMDKKLKSLDYPKYKVRYYISVLRNCFTHDIELHPNPFKMKKILENIYMHYIGQKEPEDSDDWFDLQIYLYDEIIVWLETVFKYLQKNN